MNCVSHQANPSRKLAAAEVGLIHPLTAFRAALEHRVVLLRRHGVNAVGAYFHVGMNAVGHVAQQQAGALLSIIFNIDRKFTFARSHCLLNVARGDHRCHLIAPQVDESDGLEHFDAAHVPTDGWLPQYRLKHSASCGRRDDVVGDPLDLHLGPSEASEFTREF